MAAWDKIGAIHQRGFEYLFIYAHCLAKHQHAPDTAARDTCHLGASPDSLIGPDKTNSMYNSIFYEDWCLATAFKHKAMLMQYCRTY